MKKANLNEIKHRWSIFCGEPFPDSMAGHEVDGICVTSLDTFAAGCIDTFVTNGSLDLHRRDVLESCFKELQVVVPQLTGEPQNYFRELLRLSRAVLSSEKK